MIKNERDMHYSKESSKPNICVITNPFNRIGGTALLTPLIDVLRPISTEIFIITGHFFYKSDKRIHIIRISGVNQNDSMFIWTCKQTLIQMRAFINLLKVSKNVDIVIFYLGAKTYLLSLLLAKVLKVKIIVIMAGSAPQTTKGCYAEMFFGIGGKIISRLSGFLEKLSYALSDAIILYSENLITEWNLEKYKDKICIAHKHFVDFKKFKTKKKFDKRKNFVGYIGRLSEEKGVLNFAKAIPLISKEHTQIDFLICGEGLLRNKIEKFLDQENANNKVEFTGWVLHDELPDYLNEMKLLVLPSYTEGLPNIMLEAMACGTPVLATPVGAIPDVIKDGETGFILENNSPECIAENVIRTLDYQNLEKIVENTKKLLEKEFTYEIAVERHREILERL